MPIRRESPLWTLQHLDFGPDAAATLSTAKRTVTPGGKIRKKDLTNGRRLENGPPLARGFEALHSAGRGGHVSGLSMRLCHAPLAMMPFARTGSRPIARARSATAQNGFSRSGGFNRLGASTPLCPFQHRRRESSAPKLYTATASGSRYRSPLVISAQTIRAFLFASATAATLVGRRASSWTNQGRLVPCRWA